jgi:hypothetical protein
VTAERDEELKSAGEAQLTALVRASVKKDKVRQQRVNHFC